MAHAATRPNTSGKAPKPARAEDGADGAMVTVTFRADKATLDAIAALEEDVGVAVKGRKAVAIREGLQAAARARGRSK